MRPLLIVQQMVSEFLGRFQDVSTVWGSSAASCVAFRYLSRRCCNELRPAEICRLKGFACKRASSVIAHPCTSKPKTSSSSLAVKMCKDLIAPEQGMNSVRPRQKLGAFVSSHSLRRASDAEGLTS